MDTLSLGGHLYLKISVITQTWDKAGGFSYDRPVKPEITLSEYTGPIAILFLSHHQGKRHRRRGPFAFPKGNKCLYHGGASTLHIRGPESGDQIILLIKSIMIQVICDHRIKVTDQAQLDFTLRGDHQVVPAFVHLLFPDRETMAFEIAIKVFEDLLLFSGGAVDIYHPGKKFLYTLGIQYIGICQFLLLLSDLFPATGMPLFVYP